MQAVVYTLGGAIYQAVPPVWGRYVDDTGPIGTGPTGVSEAGGAGIDSQGSSRFLSILPGTYL